MSKQKEYTNGELTIVWKPELCIHAGECVRRMPKVYNPKGRPWVTPEGASTEDLVNQINHCPTGALSYKMNTSESVVPTMSDCTATVIANGPLMVEGGIKVVDSDGNTTIKENKAAFCRCGASTNKPFCDGKHKQIGFEG